MLQRETDEWDFSATVKCSLEVSVAAEMDCLGQMLDSLFCCNFFVTWSTVTWESPSWEILSWECVNSVSCGRIIAPRFWKLFRGVIGVCLMLNICEDWNEKKNALCPFYIYCDCIQIITSGNLSWISFWYKALILSSFPKDLLQRQKTQDFSKDKKKAFSQTFGPEKEVLEKKILNSW